MVSASRMGTWVTLTEAWRRLKARKNATLADVIRLNQISFEWHCSETQATLDIDPLLAELFGPCPLLTQLDADHEALRWDRVLTRWESKRR